MPQTLLCRKINKLASEPRGGRPKICRLVDFRLRSTAEETRCNGENAELCIFDSNGRDLSAAERRHKQ